MFYMEIIAASVNLMEVFELPKLDLYNSSYGPFFGTAIDFLILALYIVQILGLIFGWEKKRIWISVLY